ncbi:MAG TPA: hypothetical protein PLV13_07345 [Ilumatobacteraceae bacterium]|nr:hypothetical protein [Ilumatobacteraceae bacterium]
MSDAKPEPTPAAAPAAETAAAPAATRRRIPKVDPGLATVTASALALIGTIVTVTMRSGGDTSTASSDTTAVTITVADTAGPTTVAAAGQPIVQLVSQLDEADRALVESGSDDIFALGSNLPLIVDDDFTTEDYAWPTGTLAADGGVTCKWSQPPGQYLTEMHSGNGAAWCSNGLQKTAANFLLTVEVATGRVSNSDVGLVFRLSDDGLEYYDLRVNPQTQTVSLAYVSGGANRQIIPASFADQIHKEGSNRVTVLALQNQLAISINDSLVAMVGNESGRLEAGRVLVLLQLNEPNSDESLTLTHFELRGS